MAEPVSELGKGATGDEVRALHRSLASIGLSVSPDERRSGDFGESTLDAVKRFQQGQGIARTGSVDAPTAQALTEARDLVAKAGEPLFRRIRGQVTHADGAAAARYSITVLHQGLRQPLDLGLTSTDDRGRYDLLYSAAKVYARGQPVVNLRIEVRKDVLGETLTTAPVRVRAGVDEVIDVVLGASEQALYQRFLAELAPYLDGLGLHELDADGVRFLAEQSRLDRRRIGAAVVATQAAQHARLPAAAIFHYLLLRQAGRPVSDPALWCLPSAPHAPSGAQAMRLRLVAPMAEILAPTPELLAPLLRRREQGALISAMELALWDEADWMDLVRELADAGDGRLPDWAKGLDAGGRLRAIAQGLHRRTLEVFPATLTGPYLVNGKVTTPKGHAAPSVRVRAMHWPLSAEPVVLAGPVRSGADGGFRLLLDPMEVQSRIGTDAVLALRLVAVTERGDTELGRSALQHAPRLPLTLNLGVDRELAPTEWERIEAGIRHAATGTDPSQLDLPERIDWLAGATRIDAASIRRFADALVSARDSGLPGAVHYAMTHPATATTAPSGDSAARLRRAVARGIVPAGALDDDHAARADAWLEAQALESRARVARERAVASGWVPEAALDAYSRIRAETPAAAVAAVDDRLREWGVSPRDRLQVRRGASLSRILGTDNEHLIAALLAELPDDPSSGRDAGDEALQVLAQRDRKEWAQWLGKRDAHDNAGDLEADADALVDAFERAYPKTALLGRIEARLGVERACRSEGEERRGRAPAAAESDLALLHGFVAQLSDADLADPSGNRLRDAAADWARRGIDGQDEAQGDREAQRLADIAKRLHRLRQLAPAQAAVALFAAGFASARQIAAMTDDGFALRYQEAAGDGRADDDVGRLRAEAQRIHRVAKARAAEALVIATALSPVYAASSPKAAPSFRPGGKPGRPGRPPDSDSDPNGPARPDSGAGADTDAADAAGQSATWEALFGGHHACAVRDCESVLGRGAYLVDLLELLGSDGGGKRLRTLFARRPDIEQIELSCTNAEVELPYLDLVNELLEHEVLRDSGASPSAAVLQTSAPADALRVHPEHLHPDAYALLNQAVYPWTLPFDLAHAEVTQYLSALGLERGALLRLLRGPAEDDRQGADAELGLSPAFRAILTGDDQRELWEHWGHEAEPSGWPQSEGRSVLRFLEKTGLTYAELQDLLSCGHTNPAVNGRRPVSIRLHPEDPCDLSGATLVGIDAGFLRRVHRFVRLARHLHWNFRTLDRALTARNATAVDGEALIRIAGVRRVAARLRLPVDETLSLWAALDTGRSSSETSDTGQRPPTQFERLFQDRARLDDAQRVRLRLDALRKTPLDQVQEPVMAALGISVGDFALLTGEETSPGLPSNPVVPPRAMAWPAVNTLHRWRLLARAVGLPVRDLLQLHAASGIDPFAAPAQTIALLDLTARLRSAGLSIAELDLVLRHLGDAEALQAMERDRLALLRRLQANLRGVQAAPPERRREAMLRVLGERYSTPADLIASVFEQTLGASDGAEASAQQQIDALLDALLSADLHAGLPAEITAPQSADARDSASDDVSEAPQAQQAAAAAWRAFARLEGALALLDRLGLGPAAGRLRADSPLQPLHLLPPARLPLDPVSGPGDLLSRFESLVELTSLRRRLAARGTDLAALDASLANTEGLADADAWSGIAAGLLPPSASASFNPSGLGGFPASPAAATPATWLRLLDILDLQDSLGADPAQLQAWVEPSVDAVTVGDTRAVLQRALGDAWPEPAASARDRIRRAQRRALLAHAARRDPTGGADALSDRLLVDVDMGPQRLTTRLGLAVAAVQRFGQRLLLGLETDPDGKPLTADAAFSAAWRWMQRYDDWRQARRTFLYPENYLYPELRHDKTPLFEELEQALSQRRLTDASIEDAVAAYVEGLDELARMEMLGSCVEEGKSRDTALLHLTGRTPGVPHRYCHRTWDMRTGEFSPWRRLDLDIDGDWLMPMMRDGRLTLYWIKQAKQIEGAAETMGLIPTRPVPLEPHMPMYQEQCTLSWSTRLRRGWSKQRSAEDHIARPLFPLGPPQFGVRVDTDRVRIGGLTVLPSLPPPPPDMTTLSPYLAGHAPVAQSLTPASFGQAAAATAGIVDDVLGFVEDTFAVLPSSGAGDAAGAGGNGQSTETAGSGGPWPDPIALLQGPLDAINAATAQILDQVEEIPSELQTLVAEVQRLLESFVSGTVDNVWGLLNQLRLTVNDLANLVLPPNELPQRILDATVGGFMDAVLGLRYLLEGLPWTYLQSADGLADLLGNDGAAWLQGSLAGPQRSPDISWAGPVIGFEFGYFDIGEARAQALRLAPPPGALAVGGALGMVSAAALPASLGTAMAYSLFPGYPAFHDVPLLQGVSSTSLPLAAGSGATALLRTWPGSGYVINPFSLADVPAVTIAVNLQTLAAAELGSGTGAGQPAADPAAWLEGVADVTDALPALLGARMRVIRPLPFPAFPQRLATPRPVILGEEQRGRAFLLVPSSAADGKGGKSRHASIWSVIALYHPLTAELSRALERGGVEGLYASASRPDGAAWTHHADGFGDAFNVDVPQAVRAHIDADEADLAQEHLELSAGAANRLYNWELLYFMPMLIGTRLAATQQFEAALGWYARVFDPTGTDGESPQRWWRFKRFHDEYRDGGPPETLRRWMRVLATGTGAGNQSLRAIVRAWRRDPCNAHLVARLRPGAYERAIVMRTVESLIAWGDLHFRAGGPEAVHEAAQLYRLAGGILGERPRLVALQQAESLSYRDLRARAATQGRKLGPFANALLDVELGLPDRADDPDVDADSGATLLGGASMLYFGIPVNPQLLAYWDQIEDRLSKIRQSQDIEGHPSDLSVEAMSGPGWTGAPRSEVTQTAAQTIDQLPPPYRFSYMLQKANELAADVRTFGSALLSAIERRDAEAMAQLRASHETGLLQALLDVRKLQIDEASAQLEAARRSREAAHLRRDYYRGLAYMNPAETVKEALWQTSATLQDHAGLLQLAAAVARALPDISFGAGGHGNSPHLSVSYGSQQVAGAISAAASGLNWIARKAETGSALAGSTAVYQRRQEEWDQQTALAEKDIEQIDRQIDAARLRMEIAEREHVNHRLQIDHADQVAGFLQQKFSSQALYGWMVEQLSTLHYQAYLLALDLAVKAEICWQHERGPAETTFVQVEQWTDLADGLLAGERLQQTLRRLERAYLDTGQREAELTKHLSLADIDPTALLMLKQKGECYLSLAEPLFDRDHPGHYNRRIKTVALSIPCVAGPHTNVNCRLTLEKSWVRTSLDTIGSPDDYTQAVLHQPRAPVSAMATSSGQSDSGLFELNLRDERYLPFEGAGAVSLWRIELPRATNRFDPATISDVVLHLRYTALDAHDKRDLIWQATFGVLPPPAIAQPAMSDDAPTQSPTRVRMLSARHDFPTAWHRLLHPADNQPAAVLDLDLTPAHLAYLSRDQRLEIERIACLLLPAQDGSGQGLRARVSHRHAADHQFHPAQPGAVAFSPDGHFADLSVAEFSLDHAGAGQFRLVLRPEDNEGAISADSDLVEVASGKLRLLPDKIDDIVILCAYRVVNDTRDARH